MTPVWASTKLCDVAEVIPSGVDKKSHADETPVRLCNYLDVYNNDIIHAGMSFSSATATEAEISRCRLFRDDVIITKDSETPDDIAKTAVVLEDLDGVLCGYHLAILRPNPQVLSGLFLGHLLRLPSLRKRLGQLANGAIRFGLTSSALNSLELALPPLPEQEAIAAVLSTWDRGIRQLTDLIAAKLRFKQGLMQQLLTGKRRFKGCQEEWHSVQLRDVTTECDERNRGQLGLESVMAVTKAEGIIPMKERTIGADIGRYLIVRKDWFAYNPMRINIGSIARWSGDKEIVVSPDYVVFRCNDSNGDELGMEPDYLDHLRRSGIWEKFVTAAGNGSVRVRIYFSDLGYLKFKLPSLKEQRKIANFFNTADQEIDLLRKQLDAFKQQKKGLMQKLLTGEVRVKLSNHSNDTGAKP